MQIAGYLHWDHTNRGKDSYSSLRRMACAFSVVDGMEDALLRQIPLVLFETTADMKGHKWIETFETLPPSQRQIIGDNPRFCRYDNEDTISRIGLNEEVHLVLPSETHASKVSARLFQTSIRHFHLSLVNSSTETDFRNFMDSFLDPKLLPRISSLTIAQEVWDGDEDSHWHRSINIPVFEQASITLPALSYWLPIPQHITVLEITIPYYVDDLSADVLNHLHPIRTSLRSLRLAGGEKDGLYNSFESDIEAVISFPYLQELSFDTANDTDMFSLLDALESLVIRSLIVGASDRMSSMPNWLPDEIASIFPHLRRLAYSPRLIHTDDGHHFAFTFVENFLGRLAWPHLSDAQTEDEGGDRDDLPLTWLLPNLQVLELEGMCPGVNE